MVEVDGWSIPRHPLREGHPPRVATYRALRDKGSLEQPVVDLVLAELFEGRRDDNAKVVDRLGWCLTLALASLLLETVGLAAAAALSS
jgi:hypothetical protein